MPVKPKILGVYQMSGGSTLSGDPSNLIARVSRLEDVTPFTIRGDAFAGQGRNKFFPLDSTGVLKGKLNLGTASGINFQGILAPNVIDGQFTVASPSDSSATIYWDGTNNSRVPVIRRADGTTSTVPPSNITITGLTFSVQYEALAYWSPFNACGLGFAPGTVGTPLIAFASTDADTLVAQGVAVQSAAGREPIGTISWTQPASGGTSSASDPITPPTRQQGTCVRMGTHIEPLGSFGKSEITEKIHPQQDWWHLESDGGLVLECTPDHNMYHALKGRVEAQTIPVGDKVITRFGEQRITKAYHFIHSCNKVEVVMERGHLFWANGFLSHNGKIQLPQ